MSCPKAPAPSHIKRLEARFLVLYTFGPEEFEETSYERTIP